MTTRSDLINEIAAQITTNAHGDVTAARVRQVASDIANRILDEIGAAGAGATTTITGGGLEGLTRAQAVAATFSSPPTIIRTVGRTVPGDLGGASYKKVTTFDTPVSSVGGYNVGTFTTADGSKYQQILDETGEAWVEQFGARPGATNTDVSYDNWQSFEDAKYWLIDQSDKLNVTNKSGLTLRIGVGHFYLSKSHSIEGGSYNLIGSGRNGTTIRTPWNQDGIQIQGVVFGYQTFSREGWQINSGDAVSVGFEVRWSGTNRVYVVRTAGTVGAAPTGTGTGITTGTAVVDYYRQQTWSEARPTSTDSSVVSDMTIWGLWDSNNPAQIDEDQTVAGGAYHSGILMRTRAVVERVFVLAYAGHGISISGDGDMDNRGPGNVNQWKLDRISAYYNGHDGIHVMGADANAGVGIDIDTAYNGRWGVADWCFLGNRWLNIQSALDGNTAISQVKWAGAVTHNGYLYIAALPVQGATPEINQFQWTGTEPGVDQYNWVRVGGDGTNGPSSMFPRWVNGTRYQANGSYSTINQNARTTFFGAYIEGGTLGFQACNNTLTFATIGGGDVTRGGQAWADNQFKSQLHVGVDNATSSGTKVMTVSVGPLSENAAITDQVDSTILRIADFENANDVVLRGTAVSAVSITASIASQTFAGQSFTGQIGLGDFTGGDNAYPTVLFVQSVTGGTITQGQELNGTGIPAGTTIANDGYQFIYGWDPSYEIIYGSTSHAATIGPEAMTTSLTRSVLTVTAASGTILQGAVISGTGVAAHTQIVSQINPTTGAVITFTGGTGSYALSKFGMTISSESMTATPDGSTGLDFAMQNSGNAETQFWGWTGNTSKRLWGRAASNHLAFWVRHLLLGDGGAMGGGSGARVIRYGSPPGVGDYANGEIIFSNNPTNGQPWGWMYLTAASGATGAPKWMPLGTVA